MFDADLNGSADFAAFNDREIIDINYVYGHNSSPDGVFCFNFRAGYGHLRWQNGDLRSRAAFSVPLSTTTRACVGRQGQHFCLHHWATGNGDSRP